MADVLHEQTPQNEGTATAEQWRRVAVALLALVEAKNREIERLRAARG